MTKKKTKKKKNTAGRFVVLLILLLMLAALLALKFFGIGPGAAPAKETPSASDIVSDPSAPSETDSQGIAYLSGDESEAPAETSTPAPTLAPAAPEVIQEPVILEEQGNIEIIIPDDMGSEGF